MSDRPIDRLRALCQPEPPASPRERFEAGRDLFKTALRLRRQTLRREQPELDDAAIEALVGAWLSERPGAEGGDAIGRVRWIQTR